MGFFFTRGISQGLILVLIFVSLAILASPFRRFIWVGQQSLGLKLGLNFNNISKDSYVEWIRLQSGDLENSPQAIFLNKQVTFQDTVTALRTDVLGEATEAKGERWIEVDLSEQKLYMKEGETPIGSYLISSGKWAPTPTGEWRIWTKLRYTRMRGGSKALGTYYDLPNVPYTMYYYQGYGIHGAYWHNNFGQPMSHGCINMKPEEAGIVFNWASVGTRVVVHE